MHHGTLQGLIETNRTNGSELNERRNTTPTKRKIKRVARAKGGLQDEIDEVGQWRQHPPEVWGTNLLWTTLPLPDCRTAHTHREAKRPFAVPRTHGRDMRFAPPGLFAERYFHHGIDLNVQVVPTMLR